VLTIIELLRQLMERQALHRIEAGTLTETRSSGSDGHSWRWRQDRRAEGAFGLEDEDLNINLGPLGDLL
jgi:hypothetical protein